MEAKNIGRKRTPRERLSAWWESRRGNTAAIAGDVIAFTVAVILTRTHLFFGARPAGLALVCAASAHVLPAFLGLAVGAISLSVGGLIPVLGGAVSLILRLLLSGGAEPFHERRAMRASSGIIGAFIVGAYEVLLRGFSLTSALYAVTTVLATGALTLIFCVFFDKTPNLQTILYGNTDFLTKIPKLGTAGFVRFCAFVFSAFTLLFLLSAGLSEYEIFGISLSYLFASCAALFFAARFGALYALAAGFFSALPLSAVSAATLALAGLVCGVGFHFGAGVALGGSALSLALFSYYGGGVLAMLGILPEYLCGTVLLSPFLKKITAVREKKSKPENSRLASDMVGTMALLYKTRCDGAEKRLSEGLFRAVPLMRRFADGQDGPTPDEYRAIVTDALDICCKTCRLYPICGDGGKKVLLEKTVGKLIAGEGVSIDDLGGCCGGIQEKCTVLDVIRKRVAALVLSRCERNRPTDTADLVSTLARLYSEAKCADERERAADTALTEKLTPLLAECGMDGGVISAFGDRRKTVFIAGEDPDGKRISSPELRDKLGAALGAPLTDPSFYRREDTVIMECRTAAKFRVESAVAQTPSLRAGDVSGDSVRCFEGDDGCYFAALSDGMGTGKEARRTSDYCTEFLSHTLGTGISESGALGLLNRTVRGGYDERCATVDLFAFDTLSGEGRFIKSGAAPSYVKRGSSLYRVRSQTVPIGVTGTPDAERIRVEIEPGDLVVMLSDGISAAPEDAPWLLDWLSRADVRVLSDFADGILRAALRNRPERCDDMTVVVLRVLAA